MKFLLDTNIALYLLGGRLIESLPDGDHHVSVITELELLSYPAIQEADEIKVRAFLADVVIVGLSDDIKTKTINLRRHHGLKLPDAIIMATALAIKAEVLTNDQKLLRLPNVVARSLGIRSVETVLRTENGE